MLKIIANKLRNPSRGSDRGVTLAQVRREHPFEKIKDTGRASGFQVGDAVLVENRGGWSLTQGEEEPATVAYPNWVRDDLGTEYIVVTGYGTSGTSLIGFYGGRIGLRHDPYAHERV